jgi:hypothetical protein
MLETYAGILRDNHIEWCGEAPENLPPNQGIRVYVTVLDKIPSAAAPDGQGKHMAEALEKAAALCGLDGLADPAAWENRQDRLLPGRES